MKHPDKDHLPTSSRKPSTLEEIGGEPLDGSGFETETPEPGFSEDDPAPVPDPAAPSPAVGD